MVRAWFLREGQHAWATCAITENGAIRILAHRSYPNIKTTPSRVAESIRLLRLRYSSTHEFWKAHISLADADIFDLDALTGPKQTTDAYLAGVAHVHGGRLTTLDGAVPWRAVRGAPANLVLSLASEE
jgi:hypothetical protein